MFWRRKIKTLCQRPEESSVAICSYSFYMEDHCALSKVMIFIGVHPDEDSVAQNMLDGLLAKVESPLRSYLNSADIDVCKKHKETERSLDTNVAIHVNGKSGYLCDFHVDFKKDIDDTSGISKVAVDLFRTHRQITFSFSMHEKCSGEDLFTIQSTLIDTLRYIDAACPNRSKDAAPKWERLLELCHTVEKNLSVLSAS